ncbi:MAG TPA: hypothetical protein PLQ93_13530 [Bacteroidia bacterium]|nr:hypothetical protein [Bacteroidia bacterium]
MKYIISLSLLLLLSGISASPVLISPIIQTKETPAHTVFIKHPAAEDVNRYFSEASMFQLEIYKTGTKEELQKILTQLRKDKAVESCTEGVVTGDFQAVVVSLKQAQNKTWFINWLKSAGLNHIKINNKAVTEIEKL